MLNVWQSHPAKGDMPQKQVPEFLCQVVLHCFCGSHPRQNRITTNFILCFMDCDQLGQIVDRRLAGSVSHLRDVRDNASYGGNVNDAAALLCCHMLCRSLTGHKDASQVQVDGIQKHRGFWRIFGSYVI